MAAAQWNGMMNRLGIDAQTSAELRRVGIGTIANIESLDKAETQRMCEHVMRYPHPNRPANAVVCVSAPSIKNLQTLACWCTQRRRIGLVPTPNAFNAAALADTKERVREVKAHKDAEKDQDLAKPNELKFVSKWITFWESILTYFGSIRGAADIPLTHVFREEEAVDDAARDERCPSWDDCCIRCAELDGVHHVADNTRVWNELKPLVHDGPGWDFIRQHEATKDGRAAIAALRVQNESSNSTATRKNKACKALSALVHTGPKKNFSFENHVSAHLHGHHELQACGEPVPETKKVTDFLEGIEDDRLESAKDTILGDPTKLGNFDETQRHLSLVMTNKKVAGQKRRSRQIAEVDTGKQNKKRKKNENDGREGHNLPINGTKTCSKHQWWNVLSKSDRDKVMQLRKQRKDSDKNKKTRAASSAATTEEDAENSEQEEEPTKDAGNQFGRGSHKKGKSKN